MKFAKSVFAATLALGSMAVGTAHAADSKKPIISSTPPPAGITFVEDVVMQDLGADFIQFEAVGSNRFSMNNMLAVVYCRAIAHQEEKSYAAWGVESIQRVAGSRSYSPQIVAASVKFYNDPIPADVKPVTADWCGELPPEADPESSANKFVDPNSIGTAPDPQ